MKRRKLQACEACYTSRVKCEFTKSTKCCDRCEKNQRKCVARVVRRGKPTFEDGSFSRDVDSSAYKALGTLEDNPHLSQHYSGANAFVKTYKGIGFEKAPPSVENILNCLYLLAIKDQSVGRLHAATTLSVSTCIDIDMTLAHSSRDGTEPWCSQLRQKIHEKYIMGKAYGPCFVEEHFLGEKSITTSPGFDALFVPGSSITPVLLRNSEPYLKLWRSFVVDAKYTDLFLAQIVKAMIRAEKSEEAPNSVSWSLSDSRRVEIKDNKGCAYTAVLRSEGLLTHKGMLNFFIFSFQDMIAVDNKGSAKLAKLSSLSQAKTERPDWSAPASDLLPVAKRKKKDNKKGTTTTKPATKSRKESKLEPLTYNTGPMPQRGEAFPTPHVGESASQYVQYHPQQVPGPVTQHEARTRNNVATKWQQQPFQPQQHYQNQVEQQHFQQPQHQQNHEHHQPPTQQHHPMYPNQQPQVILRPEDMYNQQNAPVHQYTPQQQPPTYDHVQQPHVSAPHPTMPSYPPPFSYQPHVPMMQAPQQHQQSAATLPYPYQIAMPQPHLVPPHVPQPVKQEPSSGKDASR